MQSPRPSLQLGLGWQALCAGLFACLCAGIFVLWTGFDGMSGQDAYGYAQDARELQVWMDTGQTPLAFFWTRAYSGLGALLGWGGAPSAVAVALQVLSILGLGLATAICAQWLRDREPGFPHAALLALLAIGGAPYLFRAGVFTMSDMVGIACATCALWQGGRYLRTQRGVHLALAALACGAAVALRYALGPLVLIPMLGWCWQAWRSGRLLHLLLPGLALLPVLLLVISLPQALPAPTHSMVSDWHPAHLFQKDFVNVEGTFHFSRVNLLHVLTVVFSPGFVGLFVALALLGAILTRRQAIHIDQELGLLLGSAVVYMAFIGGLPFQNDRFLLPLLPIVLLAFAPRAQGVLKHLSPRWGYLLFGLLLLAHGLLCVRATESARTLNALERRVAEALVQRDVQVLHTFDMAPALQFRLPALRIHNLYDDDMPLPQAGGFVLSRFPDGLPQWAGKAPALNWARIQAHSQLKVLTQFHPSTWILYAVP
jgi:4-amino-4-deoxy-L-arabinose transferase-like glycosyltransferase